MDHYRAKKTLELNKQDLAAFKAAKRGGFSAMGMRDDEQNETKNRYSHQTSKQLLNSSARKTSSRFRQTSIDQTAAMDTINKYRGTDEKGANTLPPLMIAPNLRANSINRDFDIALLKGETANEKFSKIQNGSKKTNTLQNSQIDGGFNQMPRIALQQISKRTLTNLIQDKEYAYNCRSDALGSTFYTAKHKLLREPIFPNTTKNRVQMTNIFKQTRNSLRDPAN